MITIRTIAIIATIIDNGTIMPTVSAVVVFLLPSLVSVREETCLFYHLSHAQKYTHTHTHTENH